MNVRNTSSRRVFLLLTTPDSPTHPNQTTHQHLIPAPIPATTKWRTPTTRTMSTHLAFFFGGGFTASSPPLASPSASVSFVCVTEVEEEAPAAVLARVVARFARVVVPVPLAAAVSFAAALRYTIIYPVSTSLVLPGLRGRGGGRVLLEASLGLNGRRLGLNWDTFLTVTRPVSAYFRELWGTEILAVFFVRIMAARWEILECLASSQVLWILREYLAKFRCRESCMYLQWCHHRAKTHVSHRTYGS